MNGTAVTQVYDGDGNRVAKTASGVTTRYLVDDLNPTGYSQVVEEIVNGAPTRAYTYGLQRIDEDQIVNNAWTPSFYGYDGFGTVRQLTSLTGAVTDTYQYDGFGNQITHTGTTPNNFLYRGEQFDPDLGMYYLRARYYNPQTGRFMSRDPRESCDCELTKPASLHSYLYAEGDPVDLIDPLGQSAVPITPPPAAEPARPPAGSEYVALIGAIALAAPHYLPKIDRGISCIFQAAGDALGAGLGVRILWPGCTAVGSRLPYIPPYGDRPAPFDPEEVITTPGTPWKCDAEKNCEAPCPPGSKRTYEKLHWDPGYYGEPPHWDYTDCDGNTWKIYPQDGTMGPG